MRNSFNTIETEKINRAMVIKLNRPGVHNAFNPEMLDELINALADTESDPNVRSVIFTGNGKSFSAGADLNWMTRMIDYSYEENIRDSEKIALLFNKIYKLKKPVISAINGAAIGGGMGFVATSDIVISSEKAQFGLSEVRIGLIPAVISTYLLKKSSPGKLKELFLTGRRFTPKEALEAGLINRIVEPENLIQTATETASVFNSSGPYALEMCKLLFEKVPEMSIPEASKFTAEILAKLRTGEEAQEGMRAFLEKRKPKWSEN